MYYISEFCRVCLQFEKPLIDIMKKETESETLINKLKLCVSEVEWSVNENLLMCQTCVEKLNLAFEFKRQCLQSAQALEMYISQLIGLEDSEAAFRMLSKVHKEEDESQKAPALIHVKPNQPLLPTIPNIILTATNNTNQNAFQNIFLNLIPSSALQCPTPSISLTNGMNNSKTSSQPQIKDTNQNMFLNINNTLHQIFPIIAQNKEKTNPPPKMPEDVNISQILTASKTEELSVEIDPAMFECEDDRPLGDESTDIAKDWEELISSNKIGPEILKDDLKEKPGPNISIPLLNASHELHTSNSLPQNNFDCLNKYDKGFSISPVNNFVPIRPKMKNDFLTSELEEKIIEFLSVDHFMAPKETLEYYNDVNGKSLICEECGQACDTLKALRYHIKQFHLGKFPYKCKYCSSYYALKSQYESHMHKHMMTTSDAFSKDTITLEDLSTNNETILYPNSAGAVLLSPNPDLMESDEGGYGAHFEHRCDLCPRGFNSPHGLSRHKVRKHNQQTRRKYFVKGMKNAKCDICNREFSTQSYLQLHIKLHYRKNDYRLKVFNKEKYEQEKIDQDKSEANKEQETTENDQHEAQDTSKESKSSESENIETEIKNERDPTETAVEEETTIENAKEATTGNSENPVLQQNLKAVPEEIENNLTEDNKNEIQPITNKKYDNSEKPKSLKGIKIKINLRNLKKPKNFLRKIKSPLKESNKENSDSISSGPIETPMEIDQNEGEETVVNGQIEKKETCNNYNMESSQEEKISSDTSNIKTECNESIDILSPKSELSEELESSKDEGLTEEQRPPLKIEMVNGKPKCNFCDKLFHRKHDLKRHINNIHLKAIQYKCHLCNSQFYEAFHLTRHLRQHNGFVRCAICLKEFSILRDLKLHMNAAHENISSCQCGTCDQVFERIKHLREHMHEHDKSIIYKCHICSSEFKESRDLSKHLVEHSGMYSCNICHTTFSTEQELITHTKYHNKERMTDKKYECEICHNKYKKKRYLSAHVNNCHSLNKNNVGVTINRVGSENDSS